jgi:hypothetical protein
MTAVIINRTWGYNTLIEQIKPHFPPNENSISGGTPLPWDFYLFIYLL